MPNQSHSGIMGIPWHRCDRCGQDVRTSELRRQPGLARGLLVCHKCWDNPQTFYRDIQIQDVLSMNADEEMQVADVLKEPIDSDSPDY